VNLEAAIGNVLDHWEQVPNDLRGDPGYEALHGAIKKLYECRINSPAPWKCKAQRTADPPQDCDWPVCGCDPYADKVIEALQESGKLR
jgi:hypothetical protein